MEDCDIIRLYQERNEGAIRESIGKYGALLNRIAYGVLCDAQDTEECVNDTYQRAWATIPPQEPHSLCAYLGRICRNLSLSRRREKHTQKREGKQSVLLSELSEGLISGETAETEVDFRLFTEILNRWLTGLPKDDRVLFLHRYWFYEDLKHLAAECGTTTGIIKGRLYRLRMKLKNTLESEGIFI